MNNTTGSLPIKGVKYQMSKVNLDSLLHAEIRTLNVNIHGNSAMFGGS